MAPDITTTAYDGPDIKHLEPGEFLKLQLLHIIIIIFPVLPYLFFNNHFSLNLMFCQFLIIANNLC